MRIQSAGDVKGFLWKDNIGLCLLLQAKSSRASYAHHIECNIGEYSNRTEEEWCHV